MYLGEHVKIGRKSAIKVMTAAGLEGRRGLARAAEERADHLYTEHRALINYGLITFAGDAEQARTMAERVLHECRVRRR